jgi:ribosomal protein L11 methyltransferase
MKKPYFRIRLTAVSIALESQITELCFANGCLGISEVLGYTQKDLVYEPDLIHKRYKDIDVFFDDSPSEDMIHQLKEIAPGVSSQVFQEEHKDWLEEWKKGFEAFALVGPFWIVPSWLEAPKEAGKPLLIDPGMAFGTGTHATTKLAAGLVYKILKAHQNGVHFSVLDVGTGTGILAMLAAKMGASVVLGVEIDPEARRVARENIQRNHAEVLITDSAIEDIRETFDFVVANIIDGVLINLKEDLVRTLKPGGHLVVTGILEEREELFLDQFMKDTTLTVERRLAKEEWVGFWMKKT